MHTAVEALERGADADPLLGQQRRVEIVLAGQDGDRLAQAGQFARLGRLRMKDHCISEGLLVDFRSMVGIEARPDQAHPHRRTRRRIPVLAVVQERHAKITPP